MLDRVAPAKKLSVRFTILLVLLVLLFLSAAKSHGRQFRLERELQGHWSVSFTEKNHPWVDSFWLRNRIVYWSIAVAVIWIIRTLLRKKSSLFASVPGWAVFLFAFPLSMITAFVLTGLLSAARLFFKISGGATVPGQDWSNSAIWGSAGWWLLTVVLIGIFIATARTQGSLRP